MEKIKLKQEFLNADVIIIGGGLAGCMAAIRAAEVAGSSNVLLVEKACVQRSGNAATGVDHTWSYMPEIHQKMGFTIEQLLEDHIHYSGYLEDHDLIYIVASTIADRIKEMEKWGFPFKTKGEYDYVKKIHRVPSFLHWSGRDQKVLFSKELSKRGIKVLNRLLVTDLISSNNQVVGAIGVGVRDPKIYVMRSKATIIATSGITRLFPSISGIDFNRAQFAYSCGEGIAMAARVGAELTCLEFVRSHSGPKNLTKSGRGTYIGIIDDTAGNPLGQVRTVADPKKIDLSVESPMDMTKAYRGGRGPIYMNCTGISDEAFEYMTWGLSNEGNIVTLEYMKSAGIDPRKDRIEFMSYEPHLMGGLAIGPKGETNISGLYAAGDAVGNLRRGVSPGAYAIGWRAGEAAAEYTRSQNPLDMATVSNFIEEKIELYNTILSRENGDTWKDLSLAVQNVMAYYVGEYRYESLLKAGLAHLRKIRDKAIETLKAGGMHDLMRCIESLCLIDVGEAVILSILERKESRLSNWGSLIRVDYPDTNEKLNKMLILKMENGKPVFHWRDPRPPVR
ncbi:FAD-dependent oxidoreductase [Chloroflexota bacterium]